MKHLGRWIRISSTLLVALSACSDEAPRADRPSLQAHVDAIASAGAIGVQAELTSGAQRDWAGAGMGELATHRQVARGDRFRIASTTKSFVAATVLSLVDDGQLALDDTIERWLPGLVASNGHDGAAITVRHLLQHRSGLANHVDDQIAELLAAPDRAAIDALLQRAWPPDELVQLAIAHPRLFAPGADFAYTDTGYVLLGMIVEAATGTTWEAALSARVLAPLALADTYAPRAELTIAGAHMHGYGFLPGSEQPDDLTAVNPTGLGAAGALVSTPADVNAFFVALVRGALFSPDLVAQMTATLRVGPDRPGVEYGLGLAWAPLPCGDGYFMHDGDTVGYHTRNGVTAQGERSVTIAITGDADFEAAATALIEHALCDDALASP
jgi:D-alanyl-D-alanine carboxypeptidase